ncbi:MAG: hypothetical protein ACTHQ3_01400 [Motilibacteraceae bacterium]
MFRFPHPQTSDAVAVAVADQVVAAALPTTFPALVRTFDDLRREVGLPINCCILASYTIQGALERLGYRSEVCAVDLNAANPAAHRYAMSGCIGPQPSDAFTVGTAGTDSVIEDQWDGHAVVLASARTDGRSRRWLLDPTLPQISRPEKNLHLMPLITQATGGFLAAAEPQIATDGQGTVVAYIRRPDMTGHRNHDPADRSTLTPWLVDELYARVTACTSDDARAA